MQVTPFKRLKRRNQNRRTQQTAREQTQICKGKQLPLPVHNSRVGSRYSLLPYSEAQKAGWQTPASQNPPNPAGAQPLLDGLGIHPAPPLQLLPFLSITPARNGAMQARARRLHAGWVTPRSRHSTAPAPPAPVGPHIKESGPAPRLGSPTLSKRGSCEGRLGPHSTGSGGVYGGIPTRSAEGGGGERRGLSPATLRPRGGHRGAWPRMLGPERVLPPPPPSARALTAPAGARSPGTISHARSFTPLSAARVPRRPLSPSPPLTPHSPPLTSGPRPSGVAPLRPRHVTHQPMAAREIGRAHV